MNLFELLTILLTVIAMSVGATWFLWNQFNVFADKIEAKLKEDRAAQSVFREQDKTEIKAYVDDKVKPIEERVKKLEFHDAILAKAQGGNHG